MALTPELKGRIDALVETTPVTLFMKGSKAFPQCGFSAAVVQILKGLDVSFETVNVLQDADIRAGIKEYSDWPTIPQLYINKEFVGGSDIVKQLAASGELHGLLGIAYEAPKAPAIEVTDTMIALFREQAGESGGLLRLKVGEGFRYDLGVDRAQPGDFQVETNGITVLVDRESASRADGIRIDFQDGPQGGVIISNPNEPPQVQALTVEALKTKMDAGESFELFDVRTPEERAIATITGARMLDQAGAAYLEDLAKDTPLIFHCHHGGRSQQAADHFRGKGFTNVSNLVGGIDAWSATVDPNVPRY